MSKTGSAWIVASAMLFLFACAKPAPDPAMETPLAATRPGTTLTANPDPIYVEDASPLGETALTWTTNAPHTEMHVNAPNGQMLFQGGGSKGTVRTGKWVTNGMTFYLQDSDNPKPGSADATLGSLAIAVQ